MQVDLERSVESRPALVIGAGGRETEAPNAGRGMGLDVEEVGGPEMVVATRVPRIDARQVDFDRDFRRCEIRRIDRRPGHAPGMEDAVGPTEEIAADESDLARRRSGGGCLRRRSALAFGKQGRRREPRDEQERCEAPAVREAQPARKEPEASAHREAISPSIPWSFWP